jgi:hypothetical protein
MDLGSQNSHNIRIGELLIKAGFLTQTDLDDALQIAKDSGQLVGRVLVISQFVTEHRLTAALRAQELIRSDKVNLDTAIRVLHIADKSDLSFDLAMGKLTHFS